MLTDTAGAPIAGTAPSRYSS